MGRLLIVTGPSCMGKSPLIAAVRRLCPDRLEGVRPLVLYNSRSPRPGEHDGEDYHFRRRKEIESLSQTEGVSVMNVRGDLQAIDFNQLAEDLADWDVLYEGNPRVATALVEWDPPAGVRRESLFLAPLSREEIEELLCPDHHLDLPDLVADVMRRKLLRRMRRQKGELSLPDLEEIERRCRAAYDEMKLAARFDAVLANHDGEDSENWDAFYYPLGDARRTFRAFVDILDGRAPGEAETWPADLLP